MFDAFYFYIIIKTQHCVSNHVPLITSYVTVWPVYSQEGTNEHSLLTPLLPQPVKFLGWTIHKCHPPPPQKKQQQPQYTFQSYNTSTFSAICFDENPFTCQYKKEDKKAVFKFHIFTGCFEVISWQWRG